MINFIKKWYVWLPTILTLFAIFYFFTDILFYLFTAIVLSMLGQPIVEFFDDLKIGKRKIPHSASAGIALILILSAISALLYFTIPIIGTQAQLISQVDINAVFNSFNEPITSLENDLKTYQLMSSDQTIEGMLSNEINEILKGLNFNNILTGAIGMIGSLFIGIFSVIFITYFFLKDQRLFYRAIMIFTPHEYQDEITRILIYSKKMLVRYFSGLILEQLIVITLVTIGLSIVGVKNALLLGIIYGGFNIIPYIGPLIGGTIAVLLGLTTLQDVDFMTQAMPFLLKELAVLIVVKLIDDFVLQPVIYSKSVKAHPLEIFIVVLMAGSIAGPVGMIFAIPAYTVLRIIASEFFSSIPAIRRITGNLNKELENSRHKEKNE